MDFKQIPTTLDVSLYGKMEQVSPVISKCRVRIFYKGMNRNRTFISEDFANQLISSLPYTPIKGIFDKDEVDFTDHGEDNTDGRIYGIVPANCNFAWEDHKDEDGVIRSYACSDVLLFTGLYPEAKLIPNESQSMEIFRENLIGEWRISEKDKQPYYYFLHGCLVGLQVLGTETEPCFEGAAFFNYFKSDDLKILFDYIIKCKQGEEKKMDKTLFRISDSQKYCKLNELLNPNFNEENGWIQDRLVCEVYNDYALIVNLKDGSYERTYYTVENDEVSIGETVKVRIVDVSDVEYAALEALQSIGDTYEAVNTAYNNAIETQNSLTAEKTELETKVSDYELKVSEFESKITEFENKISELETKNSESENLLTEYSTKIENLKSEKIEIEKNLSDITSEKESLVAFKKNVEKEKKEAILTKYEEYLTETAIANFKAEMENFSVEDFKKEVCTAAVENDSTIFSSRHNEPEMFYKSGNINERKVVESPVVKLLNNYKNGGCK